MTCRRVGCDVDQTETGGMSPSTCCTPKCEESVGIPTDRDFKAALSSQCHSPTTLQFGRQARREIGPQVPRRCAAGRCSTLQKTFRKLPGTEQSGLLRQVRPCGGWWTHSQQRPPRRKQNLQTPEVKRGHHAYVPILASRTPCSA